MIAEHRDEGKVASIRVEVTKQRQRKAENSEWQAAWLWKYRSHLETDSVSYQFGEFTLDLARGCVLKGGRGDQAPSEGL